jgi:hypothetical protein
MHQRLYFLTAKAITVGMLVLLFSTSAAFAEIEAEALKKAGDASAQLNWWVMYAKGDGVA